MDLHQGFREPALAPAQELARFLSDVDRLPGVRAIRAAMREEIALRPGMRLLDAGCGRTAPAEQFPRQRRVCRACVNEQNTARRRRQAAAPDPAQPPGAAPSPA